MNDIFKSVLRDRVYLSTVVISALLVFVVLILGAINIRPSELQVPVRFSSFGITKFYTEQWFYQFSFIVFSVGLLVVHTLIGLKIYKNKDRLFALTFQWLTIAILVIAVITVAAILRVADFA